MNSIHDIYNKVLERMEHTYPVIFSTWISEVRPISLDRGIVTLEAPSDFARGVLESQFHAQISNLFEVAVGFPITLLIVSAEERAERKELANRLVEDMENPNGVSIMDAYTFDNFVVGSSNKFAHAACLSVANRSKDSFNPLFIYGGSGLGKTHLLYAIRNAIKRKSPGDVIRYVKGDDFTNELVDALREGGQYAMRSFREGYRFLDTLLIDDIHFIGGKESTQEEFFNTFNTLYEAGKQIILTSDRPPKEIKTLEDRLRTRFEWGLIADVQPPDLETRIAIVSRKAQDLGLELPNDVCAFIAGRLKKNIRQLEGAVKKMKALHILDNQTIGIALAQDAIIDVQHEYMPINVLIDKALQEISSYFNIDVEDIVGPRRNAEFVRARHACMYVLRETSNLSHEKIGELFGKKDHSTVVHAVQRVEEMMDKDADLKNDLHEIMDNIRNA